MKSLTTTSLLLFILLHSTSAQTWEINRMTENAQRLNAISFISGQSGWMVGNKPGSNLGYIIQTTDGGETWEEQTSAISGLLMDVYFKDSLNGWIIGVQSLQKTTDGGANWSEVPLDIDTENPMLKRFDFVGTTVYAIGDKGVLLKSVDEGETWTESSLPSADFYNAIDFINENVGIAVGAVGSLEQIVRTSDGGTTWQRINTDDLPGSFLNDVQFVNESVVFTTGLNGNVFRSDDGGITFELTSTIIIEGFATNNKSLYFSNEMEGWIGGDVSTSQSSYIYYTSDGGMTWEQQYLLAQEPFHTLTDLTFAPDGTGWTCGHQMGLNLNGEVILKGVPDTTTSINEPSSASNVINFHISPNPINEASAVFVELASQGVVDITLVRSDGAMVKQVFRGELSQGIHQFGLDEVSMGPGLYRCIVRQNGETRSLSFVVAQ